MSPENTPEEQTPVDLTEDQMDGLLEQSENTPSNDIPMEKEPEAKPEQVQQYEFSHNGKQIKAPIENILEWARMGYNYPQRAQQLNQEKTQWEQQKSEWEKNWGVYRKVDDWARANPDLWTRMQEQLNNPEPQQQQTQQPDPYKNKFQQIESALSKTQEFIQAQILEKQQTQRAQEDHQLTSEIKSIREQFKDLGWDTPNEEGKTLEYRVLEHAEKHGIPSFDVAFKHLCHEQLVARAQNLGKQAVAKGIQQQTRMGVLGKSQTPQTRGLSQATDIQNKSYESLLEEALAEISQGA